VTIPYLLLVVLKSCGCFLAKVSNTMLLGTKNSSNVSNLLSEATVRIAFEKSDYLSNFSLEGFFE